MGHSRQERAAAVLRGLASPARGGARQRVLLPPEQGRKGQRGEGCCDRTPAMMCLGCHGCVYMHIVYIYI